MLRSKDKTNKLQVFVYQPDALSYYVFDFRDTTVVAYKKTRPITIRRRTISGVIKGSLSETLGNEGVEAALARESKNIFLVH
jgi:hypothetical protein